LDVHNGSDVVKFGISRLNCSELGLLAVGTVGRLAPSHLCSQNLVVHSPQCLLFCWRTYVSVPNQNEYCGAVGSCPAGVSAFPPWRFARRPGSVRRGISNMRSGSARKRREIEHETESVVPPLSHGPVQLERGDRQAQRCQNFTLYMVLSVAFIPTTSILRMS